MSPLRVEILRPGTDGWALVGEIQPGDSEASISDNHDDGRDVYSFGIDAEQNQGYINKSEGGVDFEVGRQRAIDSLGFTAIARLNSGESYQMEVKTDKSPEPRVVKFTYTG